MKTESRFIPLEIELREGDDGSLTLVSHAPPWESLSVDMGGFREKFERGAFSNLVDDIVATYEHNSGDILGRTSAGTLRLKDDENGLRYAVDLDDTTVAQDVGKRVKNGNVRGSSFEFAVRDGGDAWTEDENGRAIRTVLKGGAKLFQVGPVTRPAYQDTSVALRSLEHWHSEQTASDTSAKLSAARRRLRLAEAE